jgi:hypothetical protein
MGLNRIGNLCAGYRMLLFFLLPITGCTSVYVDSMTQEIPVSEYRRLATVHPVQLLFEFQTNGVVNAVATGALKESVAEQVSASGLFSEVTEEPVPGGALLGITVNNVAVTDDAFSKGFVAGLTFGLAGSQVTDGYICTAKYSDGTDAPLVEKRARHAIHATVGASSKPDQAVEVSGFDEAVNLMMRQVISNVLNDLSNDIVMK